MKRTFHWAHHLWLHGHTATWYVAETFDVRVLQWLKHEYRRLVHQRPAVMYCHGGLVMLFYRDRTDSFGRACTEISAAFCAGYLWTTHCFVLNELRKHCNDALAQTENRLDPIHIDIAWTTIGNTLVQQIAKTITAYRRGILLSTASLVLVILGWIGFGNHALFTECRPSQYRYTQTVALWNQLMVDHPLAEDSRLWSRCRPEQTVAELNRLLDVFRLPLSREIWSDLDSAARSRPNEFFANYADFLAEITFTQPPPYWQRREPTVSNEATITATRLALTHDDHDVQALIRQVTHQSSSIAALKVLGARHDPCLYFYFWYAVTGHRTVGLCRDIETVAEPYRALHQWIVVARTLN